MSITTWSYLTTTLQKALTNLKKYRLLRLYDRGKYESMARLFRKEHDYIKVTFD